MLRDAKRPRSSFVPFGVFACLSFASFGHPARADLFLGNTLSYQVLDTSLGSTTPTNFLVNDTSITDTPEITLGGSLGAGGVVPGTVTVTDHLLYFQYDQAAVFQTATFNGYIFRDVSTTIPPITSVTVDPSTTLVGLNSSRITFDATDIFINVSALSAQTGQVVQIDVNLSAIPEPSPLALITVGSMTLGAISWVRHRLGS